MLLRKYNYSKTKIKELILDIKLKNIDRILEGKIRSRKRNSNLSIKEFEKLQTRYKSRSEYGYDKYSTWARGFNRALQLINIEDSFKERNLDILELCCGDGMTGKILNDYGHNVLQHDISDWRDPRARSNNFLQQDLSRTLQLPDSKFDLVFSYNSFEHIPNPAQTLSDIKASLKPDGIAFIEFGPLYNSPWGLHVYRTIFFPYPQFLFSEEFVNGRLEKLGIKDLGRELNKIQPLNKWSFGSFEDLWIESGLKIINKEFGKDFTCLNIIEEFPNSFINKGLDRNEVSTQWIRVILQK